MPQGLNASIELGAGGMRAQPVKIDPKFSLLGLKFAYFRPEIRIPRQKLYI